MAQATKVVYGHSSRRICGGAVTSPEVITCACTTGSGEPEVSNFPPKFKFSANIQIDQWERFPPKKNLPINPKNQSEAASYFLSNEFGKAESMKTFDSSNQSEKHPALVFFKFKSHHFFSNSRSERMYC